MYCFLGFQLGKEHTRGGRNITHLEFYAYREAIRDEFSRIHFGRKLFLHYLLDTFKTVEGNRLECYRKNQNRIRAEN